MLAFCGTDLAEVDAEDADLKAQYLDYLRHYRACLAQKDISRLEDDWRALDEKWMKIRCCPGAGDTAGGAWCWEAPENC